MMPCTKLRKSLHVGQAQQRKRKYKKGEERGEDREREEFRQKIKADREKKQKQQNSLTLLFRHGTRWPVANKRETHITSVCSLS